MMPSEDEDFDAVSRPVKPRKPRTRRDALSTPPQEVSPVEEAPKPTTVAVSFADDPTPAAVEEETPVSTPEFVEPHFDEPIDQPVEVVAPEPVVTVEAETEPEAEPVVAPGSEPTAAPIVSTPVEAPRAVKTPKVRRPRAYGHLVLELVLVLALAGLGFFAWHLHGQQQTLQKKYDALYANPQAAVQKQTDDLLSAVGALMTLPANETPTIANVSDAAQARQQSAFFNDAQNGDKVLMYVKAGEAILYRPSTNKIILVAPLTTGTTGAAGATTTAKP